MISCIKSCWMISKGFLYHIVRVKYLDSEVPLIESIPIVREIRGSSLMTFPVFLLNGNLFWYRFIIGYIFHLNSSVLDVFT